MSDTVLRGIRVTRCIMLVKMCGPGPSKMPQCTSKHPPGKYTLYFERVASVPKSGTVVSKMPRKRFLRSGIGDGGHTTRRFSPALKRKSGPGPREAGHTGAGAIYATRRPKQCVNRAPQPLNTKRGCYGQGFSGILERSRKIPAVASWLGDPARGRSK